MAVCNVSIITNQTDVAVGLIDEREAFLNHLNCIKIRQVEYFLVQPHFSILLSFFTIDDYDKIVNMSICYLYYKYIQIKAFRHR